MKGGERGGRGGGGGRGRRRGGEKGENTFLKGGGDRVVTPLQGGDGGEGGGRVKGRGLTHFDQPFYRQRLLEVVTGENRSFLGPRPTPVFTETTAGGRHR